MAGRAGRRDDTKRFPAWTPWAAGLVGGGLLVGGQLVLVRSHVEDDLTTRAKAALAQAAQDDPDPETLGGYADFDVVFHGRDGVVSGVPAGVDERQVVLIVGGLKGVRTVTVHTLPVPDEEEAGDEAAADDSTSTTPDGTADSAEPTAPDTTAPDTTAPTPDATAPTPTPSSAPDTAEGVAEQVATLPQIPFVTGTARWEDEGNAILGQMKQAIMHGPADAVYEIQGYTDSTGDPDANLALSQRRADAVRTELINRGVPASRLTAVGYGQTKPLVNPEVTDEDRAANRRVVLAVAG